MTKSRFIAIVEVAQANGQANYENAVFYNAVASVAESVIRNYRSINDPEQAVVDACVKIWKRKCFEEKPLDLYNHVIALTKFVAKTHYKADKHRHENEINSSALEDEDEFRDTFWDSIPDPEFSSDSYIKKDIIRNTFCDLIQNKQLYKIIEYLEITKKDFKAAATVSGTEFFLLISSRLTPYFSQNEMQTFLNILSSIDDISVNRLYYKIYNESKKRKVQGKEDTLKKSKAHEKDDTFKK